MQRGLAADPSQYKLQVDHGRVSCRVAGGDGVVFVRSRTAVEARTWYRAKCKRNPTNVVLTVQARGSSTVDRVAAAGGTGRVDVPSTTPLVIGGKATFQGTAVAGNSDQANGLVDDVVLRTRG